MSRWRFTFQHWFVCGPHFHQGYYFNRRQKPTNSSSMGWNQNFGRIACPLLSLSLTYKEIEADGDSMIIALCRDVVGRITLPFPLYVIIIVEMEKGKVMETAWKYIGNFPENGYLRKWLNIHGIISCDRIHPISWQPMMSKSDNCYVGCIISGYNHTSTSLVKEQ